ncbi:MAG: methyltransferase [Thermoleophilaceae bacterium]
MSPQVPATDLAPAIAEALERGNFNTGGLMVALGGAVDTSVGVALQSRRLGHDAQAHLTRLFLFGEAVPAAEVAAAVSPATLDGLDGEGWIRRDGDAVRALVRITPFEGVLVAHDPFGWEKSGDDVVPGLSSAAETLASLTPRREVQSALDVGTGSGLHALLAARHATRVVATDLSERALAYARLSAALSGITNIEFRRGSFFEPVADEQFDLITCNPPFVISPESGLVYRDGHAGRDDVSREAVMGAAAHLAPGGLAQLLINWIEQPFDQWAAPVQRWLEGAGCDALVLHHLSENGLTYAAKWNVAVQHDPVAHGRVLDEWTEHFEREGITTLATGAITLRRVEEAPLFSRLAMATGPSGQAGEHVIRLLDAARWLGEVSDDELMATPVRLVDDHRLVSERTRERDEYGADSLSIVLEHSAGLDGELDGACAAVLVGLEGGHTPADAVPGLAPLVADAGVADVEHLVASTVRQLVSRGLVEPAGGH